MDDEDSENLSISTENLLSLIRERPCLWDKTDAGYRNKLRRDDAWSEVYRKIYPSYGTLREAQRVRIGLYITKKWCNIRDAYVKKVKGPKNRPYIYSEAMSFLDKVILGDKYNSSDYSDEQTFEGEPEVWLNETFIDVNASDEPETKKFKPDNFSYLKDENDTIASLLRKLISREEDEDRAFFNSILPTVKSLTANAKLEFRIEVMKILKALRSETHNDIVVKTNDSDGE